jgi:hypothetical protein
MKVTKSFLINISILFSLFSYAQTNTSKFETVQIFQTKEAHQGVAVGKNHFFTINTKSIAKYSKASGEFISEWKDTSNQIIHFDGGVVVKEKLYCAHSNYPGIPMTSSIEIFDINSLKHIASHSFGIKYGSCTWADNFKDSWWVCFSNYDKFETEINKGTRWTLLVEFDENWNELESWTFPENIIAELKPMSCSGGSWGPDGNLYVTGHDSAKVYVLQLPETGSVLRYIKTIEVELKGQGIAWDRFDTNTFYGIFRKENKVIQSKAIIQ